MDIFLGGTGFHRAHNPQSILPRFSKTSHQCDHRPAGCNPFRSERPTGDAAKNGYRRCFWRRIAPSMKLLRYIATFSSHRDLSTISCEPLPSSLASGRAPCPTGGMRVQERALNSLNRAPTQGRRSSFLQKPIRQVSATGIMMKLGAAVPQLVEQDGGPV